MEVSISEIRQAIVILNLPYLNYFAKSGFR